MTFTALVTKALGSRILREWKCHGLLPKFNWADHAGAGRVSPGTGRPGSRPYLTLSAPVTPRPNMPVRGACDDLDTNASVSRPAPSSPCPAAAASLETWLLFACLLAENTTSPARPRRRVQLRHDLSASLTQSTLPRGRNYSIYVFLCRLAS